jgi:hypothetical protein
VARGEAAAWLFCLRYLTVKRRLQNADRQQAKLTLHFQL